MAAQAPGIFRKLEMANYKIGENFWVDVTHINNPHSIYVRPVIFREDLEYLQRAGGQMDPNEIQDGKIVTYKSDSLDLYVRGQIFKIIREENDLKCDIKAIDYGCEDASVPIWRLSNPRSDIAVPPLAVHCLLHNCSPLNPDGWTEDVIEATKAYIGNERARMTVMGVNNNQLVVELRNSCPHDIASMLSMTGYTLVGGLDQVQGSVDPPVKEKYLNCKELKPGSVLHVRFQSGKDLKYFFVADIREFSQYLRERNVFSDYCNYQKIATIHDLDVGQGVGFKSQFMAKYERAIVKNIVNEDKVVIQQIDWGDVYEVNVNTLKLVKPEIFAQTTALAIYCSVPSVADTEDVRKSLYPGLEFSMTIKSVGKNFETPHIVEITGFGLDY